MADGRTTSVGGGIEDPSISCFIQERGGGGEVQDEKEACALLVVLKWGVCQ